MNILVTGGNGFIGSHFIEDIINYNNISSIINIDLMTYASTSEQSFNDNKKYKLYKLDINSEKIYSILNAHKITHIVHFAAETHVDNSIENPDIFIKTNINGTFNILNAALKYNKLKKFIHISTDEVFGSLSINEPAFTIKSLYKPNNPYAASKASSDLLARAYYKTYNLPIITTNCSNNFGPRQSTEKLIPLTINKLKNKELIPIYGNGNNIRDWIYVKDHTSMIWSILLDGSIGYKYLLSGKNEISNLNLINIISNYYEQIIQEKNPDFKLSKPFYKHVEDRKGHDMRYSIDCTDYLLKFPNFKFTNFNDALRITIRSYL